jgi:hypothetical protein
VGFGWIGVHDPDKWHIAVALYVIGGNPSYSLTPTQGLGTR